MKKILLIITLSTVIIILTNCNSEDFVCVHDSVFCAYVRGEDYPATGPIIDDFLKNLDSGLTDQEKLEKLKEWLLCKSCVSHAEIFCNSCIYTYPAQSELKIIFIIDGQETGLVLDISMAEPLRFVRYHE